MSSDDQDDNTTRVTPCHCGKYAASYTKYTLPHRVKTGNTRLSEAEILHGVMQ